MSEINKGGGNAPKAGEQGFQKSKAGKKVPTPSPLNKENNSPPLIQSSYELNWYHLKGGRKISNALKMTKVLRRTRCPPNTRWHI